MSAARRFQSTLDHLAHPEAFAVQGLVITRAAVERAIAGPFHFWPGEPKLQQRPAALRRALKVARGMGEGACILNAGRPVATVFGAAS